MLHLPDLGGAANIARSDIQAPIKRNSAFVYIISPFVIGISPSILSNLNPLATVH